MALVHSNSCDCTKSELDIFSLPPTQTHIENGYEVCYKPISSLAEDAPIEFIVPGQGDEYIDLSQTYLEIKAKIVKADGTNLVAADDATIGPVNNWMHSLFSQVDVYLNQKLVSPSSNAYPYRAYIENLLTYGPEAKDSHLTSVLWYRDTPEHMEAADNEGLKKRRNFTSRSKIVAMEGHIHSDIFNQEKFLLNGVELKLKFIRSRPEFHLIGNANYKTSILEANLWIRRANVAPSVKLAHAAGLSNETAKYPITRADVKANTIAAGVQSASLDNVFSGQLPTRIIVGMVSNAAFTGTIGTNPFNFQHFNLSHAAIYVDGQQIPGKILTPDFESGDFIRAYRTLFSGTGINYSNSGNQIARDEYAKGYTLFAVDFTPDLEAHMKSHWSLVRQGSLRFELRFKEALGDPVTVITYAEFDNVIEIDQSRTVSADYGA